METPETPSGLPDQDTEAQPMGPTETDPDGEAPAPGDLPGVPEPGEEGPSDG